MAAELKVKSSILKYFHLLSYNSFLQATSPFLFLILGKKVCSWAMVTGLQLKLYKCGWELHAIWSVSQGQTYVHSEEKYKMRWNKETSICAWLFFISWRKILNASCSKTGVKPRTSIPREQITCSWFPG